ncbi:unnamed protein product [Ambrosiozyma monospora]|uniref:Unnamed protein product n=1 Tax=Ambrosiozyma monospora TaxID=43982 RepID=A0ACB5U9I5_AMBMO|nr:unnamed protein product [Ambrosiozyma monospora]
MMIAGLQAMSNVKVIFESVVLTEYYISDTEMRLLIREKIKTLTLIGWAINLLSISSSHSYMLPPDLNIDVLLLVDGNGISTIKLMHMDVAKLDIKCGASGNGYDASFSRCNISQFSSLKKLVFQGIIDQYSFHSVPSSIVEFMLF